MKNIKQKTIVAIIGFSCIFIAIAINGALAQKEHQARAPKLATQYPEVSITETQYITHQAAITAYGQVNSRNQLSFSSQVSGQVTLVSEKFLTGNTFKKGELLAQIDPVAYQQALASAQATLAQAKLDLAEEVLAGEQAADEWQHSGLGDEQASALVLRKPQLAVVKAQYDYALKSLAKAQYDLKQTKLTAPFDALVVSKSIQLGSVIQVDSEIADLYDISLFEVSLPLSAHQWQLLANMDEQGNTAGNTAGNIAITLIDEINNHQW